MRKGVAWLLLLTILAFSVGASAEDAFVMAGFDGDGSNHDWATNLFFQRMEERTGVSFEFRQSTDYDAWTTEKTAMLSDGELPDVLFKAALTTQETQAAYDSGKIIDLKPYLAEYAPNLSALLAAHPEWEKAITLPNGAIAALPNINELQNNNVIWINRQWLDQLGLAVPTTAEELTEVLRAFKTGDPNGNGKADEIPLTCMGMWDLKYWGHAFGLVANDYNVYVDDSGRVQTTLTTDADRAFLTWLNELWQEKLIDHNCFTTTDSLRQITDSKADITYGILMGTTPLSLVPSTALSQYEVLQPLVYEGKQVYRDTFGDLVRGTFAITSACKDPAKLVSWVDYLYSEEGCRLAQSGLEGVEYTVNEDGTWSWLDDEQTVAQTVLAQSNISEGGELPGLSSVDFQLTYDNESTHQIIVALGELKQHSIEPCPPVYFTAEQQQRLSAAQYAAGAYAEEAMIHFVTGDTAMTDEAWQTFCNTVMEKGLTEVISIWQDAVK